MNRLLKFKDMNENKILFPDDIKEGNRIYHINSGYGTVVGFFYQNNNKIITIKFDDSKYELNFLLNSLIRSGFIRKVENDNNVTNKSEDQFVEEEEEEEEDDSSFLTGDLTEEDLSTIKVKDYFVDNDLNFLLTIDELISYRKKIKKQLKSSSNELKNKINENRLRGTYIIEEYFNKLSDKFKNKTIYRFTAHIPYKELWEIKNKYRIILKNENEQTLYNGIVYYWVFSDGIVFKTI